MSLGDLGRNINNVAKDSYALQKERIMREADEKKKLDERRESDRLNQEISHLRLHKQTIVGRMTQLKIEIMREKDARLRADKERELHKLQNDILHMEGEILSLQGREHAAHNVRYNNPHYF